MAQRSADECHEKMRRWRRRRGRWGAGGEELRCTCGDAAAGGGSSGVREFISEETVFYLTSAFRGPKVGNERRKDGWKAKFHLDMRSGKVEVKRAARGHGGQPEPAPAAFGCVTPWMSRRFIAGAAFPFQRLAVAMCSSLRSSVNEGKKRRFVRFFCCSLAVFDRATSVLRCRRSTSRHLQEAWSPPNSPNAAHTLRLPGRRPRCPSPCPPSAPPLHRRPTRDV